MEKTKRPRSGLHWIRVACFVAVTLPNCTRCCPTGFGSCQCNWAWEECPGTSSGCGSCGSSSSGSGCNSMAADEPPPSGVPEASAHGLSVAPAAPAKEDEERGGTHAFVAADSKTFLVVSLGALDEVRTFHVEANALDEDPLTVRPAGLFPFDGERPGRVATDDRGRAVVALRGPGAVVAIDPLRALAGETHAACPAPNALAARQDLTYVACGSGEVVTLRTSDGAEIGRVSLGGALGELAVSGDGLVASAGATLFAFGADAGLTRRDAPGAIEPVRASAGALRVAVGSDLGSFEADGFRSRTHASAPISDLAVLGDATAFVADGEAWLRASEGGDLVPVAEGLAARAVALADVGGEITRRVLVLQTVEPRMLVFFTVPGVPSAAAIEPLE